LPNLKYLDGVVAAYIHDHMAYEYYKKHLPQEISRLGVVNENLLLSAIENPKRIFDGAELYPTLTEKAGILLYTLIMNHPFFDGNKRTAMLSTELFLMLNGYYLDVGVTEYVDFAKNTSAGEVPREEVYVWIDKYRKIGIPTRRP
jgi:death on curing protein